MEACARADRTGLFNCPHTGVAIAATTKLVERGLIKSSDRVVVISTAHGLKFVDFKLKYHNMTVADMVSDHPNPPIELPADYQKVRDRMHSEIYRRAKTSFLGLRTLNIQTRKWNSRMEGGPHVNRKRAISRVTLFLGAPGGGAS